MKELKTNVIYCGDCQKMMKEHIPSASIDLIYMDPPFFSNKQYAVIWENGAEIRAFEDMWKGGIKHYITWMEPRLFECWRVLKPTGSMYLHCDYHANAHLRILMDGLFNKKNFQNEIIWRIGWVSGYKTQKKGWIRNHDTILYYTKSKKFTFNKEYIPYPKDYVRRDGRKPVGKGIPIEDTWNCHSADRLDSIMIKSFSKEKMGYPTQKPLALLKRIVKASSNPGSTVLDPMCGCGTALEAAERLGRKWIGIDVSPTACKVMVERIRSRLNYRISEKDIIGLPRTIDELKSMKPLEFENWVRQRLHAIKPQLDDVDGIIHEIGFIKLLEVKQRVRIGRRVVYVFETAMRVHKAKSGIIVAFSFSRDAHEEVARAKLEDDLNIELKKVEDLL